MILSGFSPFGPPPLAPSPLRPSATCVVYGRPRRAAPTVENATRRPVSRAPCCIIYSSIAWAISTGGAAISGSAGGGGGSKPSGGVTSIS
jgi:hypothetical protein